jgi:hypothetical protein
MDPSGVGEHPGAADEDRVPLLELGRGLLLARRRMARPEDRLLDPDPIEERLVERAVPCVGEVARDEPHAGPHPVAEDGGAEGVARSDPARDPEDRGLGEGLPRERIHETRVGEDVLDRGGVGVDAAEVAVARDLHPASPSLRSGGKRDSSGGRADDGVLPPGN